MRTLPYDYARCGSKQQNDLCSNCRRTEPGNPIRQVYFAAPPIEGNRCTFHIPSTVIKDH